MSHDRGCFCGREKYEYDDCDREDCDRRSIKLSFGNQPQRMREAIEPELKVWEEAIKGKALQRLYKRSN